MNDVAKIYRAEILRAVFGPVAQAGRVHDMARLNQIAEHLANCEDAQSILRAKGHGTAGMTFVEVARDVPANVKRMVDNLFKLPPVARYPDLGEIGDGWSAH